VKLWDYQEEAAEFIRNKPTAGLFIDMGLGKTAATLHAMTDLPKPILLVGPIRVIETVWERESGKWPLTSSLEFSLVRGTPSERKVAVSKRADVYMTNCELLPEVLESKSWATLVIDESTLFKNPSSKRFKNLRKSLAKIGRRYILTGTPTPNSLMDLWAQIFILDMGQRLERSFSQFKQRYFRQTDYLGYKFEPVPGAEEVILEKISDIIFRVAGNSKKKVVYNEVSITLPAKARKAYTDLEKVALTILADESVTAASAAAAMMKLRQVASGFVYDDTGESQTVHTEKV
jgi:superfamily II DNA or RNA helicase